RERFGMAAFPSGWARSWLAWTLGEMGEFAEAEAVGAQGAEMAEAARHAYSRFQALFGRGVLSVIQGRLDQAIPALEQGLVLARLESIPFSAPFITAPLGAAYLLARGVGAAV